MKHCAGSLECLRLSGMVLAAVEMHFLSAGHPLVSPIPKCSVRYFERSLLSQVLLMRRVEDDGVFLEYMSASPLRQFLEQSLLHCKLTERLFGSGRAALRLPMLLVEELLVRVVEKRVLQLENYLRLHYPLVGYI